MNKHSTYGVIVGADYIQIYLLCIKRSSENTNLDFTKRSRKSYRFLNSIKYWQSSFGVSLLSETRLPVGSVQLPIGNYRV